MERLSDWKKVITLGRPQLSGLPFIIEPMTPKEFFDKVVEMRRCQKEYFKSKRQIDLRISKQIEREVDGEIERVQKILHDKRNPQLF